jgi:hypothetical protein
VAQPRGPAVALERGHWVPNHAIAVLVHHPEQEVRVRLPRGCTFPREVGCEPKVAVDSIAVVPKRRGLFGWKMKKKFKVKEKKVTDQLGVRPNTQTTAGCSTKKKKKSERVCANLM